MMYGSLAEELGLVFRPAFSRDSQFFLALAAAPPALAMLAWMQPALFGHIEVSIALVLSMALLQPLVEELLFRGVLQGQLEKNRWARRRFAGFSAANYLTTLVFMLAHFIHHTPLWAVAVIAPSLIFGHFRDRHRQVYPAFLLHAFYNGCYLVTGMMIAPH